MPSCCAASAVTGPIDATTVVPQQVGGLLRAEDLSTKFLTADALGERHGVDLPIEQHPVDVVVAVALRFARQRPVGDDLGDLGARLAQLLAEHARGRCRPAAAGSAGPCSGPDAAAARRRTASARYSGGHQIDPEAVARAALAAVDGPTAQSFTPFRSRTSPAASSRCHEVVDGVGAGEDDPVVRPGLRATPRSSAGRILGRRDPDRRRRDRLRAALLQHVDELAGLLARSRDDDAAAEQRPIVEPAQVLAQPDDRADDEQRRRMLVDARRQSCRACPRSVRCDGSVAS